MSALFLTPDDPAYSEVALSDGERDTFLASDEADLLENEPGNTVFIAPYPGDTAVDAVRRLKRADPTICIRKLDGDVLAFHSMKAGEGGRLRAWTGLQVGQAMCWGCDGDDPKVALRIAAYLARCGLGRFVVFDGDEQGQWVRRVE